MKKPMLKTLLSVLLVAVVLVGSTLAYMLATDSPILNTFALAETETKIEETGSTDDDKSATVKNTGKSPVYVRAQLLISSGDAFTTEDFQVKYDTEHWTDGGDGFYYYKGYLAPGASTPALMTGMTVPAGVPKDTQFDVYVYHESVLAPADASRPAWGLTAAKDAFQKL